MFKRHKKLLKIQLGVSEKLTKKTRVRKGVNYTRDKLIKFLSGAAGMSRRKKTISSNCSSAKTESKSNEKGSSEKSSSENTTNRSSSSFKDEKKVRVRSKSATTTFKSLKGYFGELGADRSYLENLLKHPGGFCRRIATSKLFHLGADDRTHKFDYIR